jgi:diguanylate cyclase (GGDEF)-like protein
MRMGDPKRLAMWCGLWLCLALSCLWPALAAAPALQVQPLSGEAGVDEVLSGRADARLEPARSRALIQQPRHTVQWWRISTDATIAAEASPRLLLHAPFLYRVEAWVPGADRPTRHALYGADADDRYSHRALVVALPEGLAAGQAVWLRVEARSGTTMPVTIEPLDDVRRDDLAFVAWRAFILSVLLVLVMLALAFWAGTGEPNYGWFGAMLCFAVLYIVSIGGDARMLPWADALFGSSARANRIVGGLGIICSNLFQRAYLDLPGKLPRIDRLLWACTGLAAITAGGSALVDAPVLAHIGNIALLASAALLLAGSAMLAWRGDRPGRVVVLSWLPLMTFATLAATEKMGAWVGPAWLAQGLAGSFALAGLLLTVGLADKLLQLRRDRDDASARARADDLTGMLNRPGVEEALRLEMDAAQARRRPLSIAFVDLDHFKRINDEHGHGIGDQCLRIVAQRIRNQLRGGDIVGRYGGDEFLVVLPATGLDEAMAIAQRMLASVDCRPLTMDEMQLRGSLSIGVAQYAPGETIQGLFDRADAALYASKAAGRNRVMHAIPPHGDALPA